MLTISAIPAFTDNYIWCLHDGPDAWVVDPGDAAPVETFLRERDLQLSGILITHHHPDHTGGIAALTAARPQLPVYGPDNPRIDGIRQTLHDGAAVTLLNTEFRVVAVPGHTLDHIAFYAGQTSPPMLFCGDTLFAAGCGRLFEGSPAQMLQSLHKLAALPPETRVYCTHEYTLSNLRFACAVEPDNAATLDRTRAVEAARAAGRITLPSTIALELATNPFLRGREANVRRAARTRVPEASSELEIFTAIRGWKDQF